MSDDQECKELRAIIRAREEELDDVVRQRDELREEVSAYQAALTQIRKGYGMDAKWRVDEAWHNRLKDEFGEIS